MGVGFHFSGSKGKEKRKFEFIFVHVEKSCREGKRGKGIGFPSSSSSFWPFSIVRGRLEIERTMFMDFVLTYFH